MVAATFVLFEWVLILVFWILSSIAFYKLAVIAGRKDIAWFAWIPVLAQILQLRLIDKSGWWVLMYLIPIANFIFAIIWRVKLLNAFGKSGAFVLFYVFLQPVYLILWMVWAFSGDLTYRGGGWGGPSNPPFYM
ncbi:DUF5684 domain-containing protein [Alicyclobacillus tolerans]|uniref:DUF5684 domain-containing protein n=1 Tax=Alicyclobacillus tolerans TaxID=90970 RepID=UPI001F32BDDD|nr:DUF5684 domain-containing protein [Alicyclobacillus tolerans]MCF8565666.1 DUF5684 domain-containing protein [Alicyclobacillus tolerans]